MTDPEFFDVAARWSIHLAYEAWLEDGWEDHFPEFGEYDFERLTEYAKTLLPEDPTSEETSAAYTFFEGRAE